MPRDLAIIDQAIDVERAIWIMERRAGRDCPAAEASRLKLDKLLEERSAAERASRRPLGRIR